MDFYKNAIKRMKSNKSLSMNRKTIAIVLTIIVIVIMIFMYNPSILTPVFIPIVRNRLSSGLDNPKSFGLLKIVYNGDQILFKSKHWDHPREHEPRAIVTVTDINDFITSVIKDNEIGLGESYVHKSWFADDLMIFIQIMCFNFDTNKSVRMPMTLKSKSMDQKNIEYHYDVGNDFYETFLTDKLMAYTCGFWKDPRETLDDSQFRKVDTVLTKLKLKPGMKVLDIGCGWGRIGDYVSNKEKVTVYGLTISRAQYDYMKKNTSVIPIYGDYRDIAKLTNHMKFDAIYSIGMYEAVTQFNGTMFFDQVKQSLKDNGVFVMHCISSIDTSKPQDYMGDSYVLKHIFPGGQIPDVQWIYRHIRDSRMSLIHHEMFGGQHYAETLKHWRQNMLKSRDYLLSRGYKEELIRSYEYYFSSCEAAFRANTMGLSHFVIVNHPIADIRNDGNYLCPSINAN